VYDIHMIRKQIHLTKEIDIYYATIAKKTGLSQAEIIRRVLDKNMLEHTEAVVSPTKGGVHGRTNPATIQSSPSEA
jgi:hypothetical protein